METLGNINKNYGIDWERELREQSEEDYIFGGFSQLCLATIPENEREKYLPKGEVQRGKEDMSDCATRGPNNILETKLNYLYKNNLLKPATKKFFEENGYVTKDGQIELSDAFTAIKSNTTRVGNSLKAPLDAIHNFGFIPKKMLPFLPEMTWEEYHNPNRITKAMDALGERSLQHIKVNYERVMAVHFEEAYEMDTLDLAGLAWPPPVNGEYPRIEGQPNHCFMGIKRPKTFIFDNYIDEVDGDFIKKLTNDYVFMDYAYRLYLSLPPKKENWLTIFIRRIISSFK